MEQNTLDALAFDFSSILGPTGAVNPAGFAALAPEVQDRLKQLATALQADKQQSVIDVLQWTTTAYQHPTPARTGGNGTTASAGLTSTPPTPPLPGYVRHTMR